MMSREDDDDESCLRAKAQTMEARRQQKCLVVEHTTVRLSLSSQVMVSSFTPANRAYEVFNSEMLQSGSAKPSMQEEEPQIM